MTVYSDKALKKIIIENIDCKHIFNVASKLYTGWLPRDEEEKLEAELTGLLLNKQYEATHEKINKEVVVPMPSVTKTLRMDGTSDTEIKWGGKQYTTHEEALEDRKKYIERKRGGNKK